MSHVFPRNMKADYPVAVAGEGCYIIDADGNWKPNVANPPSRKGARDPTDPIQSTREKDVKFGRRATPGGGAYRREQRRVVRPPKDARYDEVL